MWWGGVKWIASEYEFFGGRVVSLHLLIFILYPVSIIGCLVNCPEPFLGRVACESNK